MDKLAGLEVVFITIGCLLLVVAIAMMIALLLGKIMNKHCSSIVEKLVNEGMNAEMLFELGGVYEIPDSYPKALELRKIELGIDEIPLWCLHDGVLPTKEDLKKDE